MSRPAPSVRRSTDRGVCIVCGAPQSPFYATDVCGWAIYLCSGCRTGPGGSG